LLQARRHCGRREQCDAQRQFRAPSHAVLHSWCERASKHPYQDDCVAARGLNVSATGSFRRIHTQSLRRGCSGCTRTFDESTRRVIPRKIATASQSKDRSNVLSLVSIVAGAQKSALNLDLSSVNERVLKLLTDRKVYAQHQQLLAAHGSFARSGGWRRIVTGNEHSPIPRDQPGFRRSKFLAGQRYSWARDADA